MSPLQIILLYSAVLVRLYCDSAKRGLLSAWRPLIVIISEDRRLIESKLFRLFTNLLLIQLKFQKPVYLTRSFDELGTSIARIGVSGASVAFLHRWLVCFYWNLANFGKFALIFIIKAYETTGFIDFYCKIYYRFSVNNEHARHIAGRKLTNI